MSICATVPLFIILCCFLLSPSFITAGKTELAIEVCKNTTDFNFCRATIYSDPRAPTADPFMLAYIAFRNAYSNATNTKGLILSKIGEIENGDGAGGSGILRGLKNCLRAYNDAIGDLTEALGDMDSESYYDFDKLSSEAESHGRACEEGFKGTARARSPITKENIDFIKLANICFVVSKLFP